MRHSIRIGFFAATGLLLGGCSSIQTHVSSLPAQAKVSFDKNEVGTAPVELKLRQIRDLMKITAALPDQAVTEIRCRFVAQDKVDMTFHFGQDLSPLARKLGLNKLLIFDYSQSTSFEYGKSDIRPQYQELLDKQAEILNEYFPTVPIYVCGHTDNIGSDEYNLGLSLKRFQAVAHYFMQRGVAEQRLKIEGFGKEYPIASNDSEEGKALNRRTEIILPQ